MEDVILADEVDVGDVIALPGTDEAVLVRMVRPDAGEIIGLEFETD